jgi:hypothetical protein
MFLTFLIVVKYKLPAHVYKYNKLLVLTMPCWHGIDCSTGYKLSLAGAFRATSHQLQTGGRLGELKRIKKSPACKQGFYIS